MKPELRNEVRLIKLNEAHRGRKWRWDVTQYLPVEGTNAGVYDARWHVGGDFGYSRTLLGASVRVIRNLLKAEN